MTTAGERLCEEIGASELYTLLKSPDGIAKSASPEQARKIFALLYEPSTSDSGQVVLMQLSDLWSGIEDDVDLLEAPRGFCAQLGAENREEILRALGFDLSEPIEPSFTVDLSQKKIGIAPWVISLVVFLAASTLIFLVVGVLIYKRKEG